MFRRQILKSIGVAGLALATGISAASAQEVVKVGLILPMTGPSASTGRQIEAGVRLWMAQNGTTVAGKKIEIIIKDDTGAADQSKRLATELVVNDKVAFLAGFGLTPLALAVGPVASQAKVPAVIMAAGTSTIVASSPYFVRTSFTLPQNTAPMAQWSAANNIKTVVTLVSDYGPGLDSEKAFKAEFEGKGGKVLDTLRAPMMNPEFAAFLQKAKDLKPDALFLFVPSGQGASLMKQVGERELAKAGIKIEIEAGAGAVTLGRSRAREYQLVLTGWAAGYPDADAMVSLFAVNPDNRKEANLTGYPSWISAWQDTGLNALADQARMERDPAKRADLYKQIQVKHMSEGPHAFITQSVSNLAANRQLKDIKQNGFRVWYSTATK